MNLNLCCGAYPDPEAVNVDQRDVRPDWQVAWDQSEPFWRGLPAPDLIRFVQADITCGIPFVGDSVMDTVHLDNATCQFDRSELTRILAEVDRVLRPGGAFSAIVAEGVEAYSGLADGLPGYAIEYLYLTPLEIYTAGRPRDPADRRVGLHATKPEAP